MTRAEFQSVLNVGGDAAGIKAALKECGYADVAAVPASDYPRVAAKVLASSRAFAKGVRKARDVAAYARDFWDKQTKSAPRPTDFEAVALQAWDNFNRASANASKASADHETAET